MKLTVKHISQEAVVASRISIDSYFMRTGVGDCLYRKTNEAGSFVCALGISAQIGLEQLQILGSEVVIPVRVKSVSIEVV